MFCFYLMVLIVFLNNVWLPPIKQRNLLVIQFSLSRPPKTKCGPFVIHHVGTSGSNLQFTLPTFGDNRNLIILALKQAKSKEKGLHQKCTCQCLFYYEMTPQKHIHPVNFIAWV